MKRDIKGQFKNIIYIESEILESLYHGNQYDTKEIASLFGCTSGCILRKMNKYNIQRRTKSDIQKDRITDGKAAISLNALSRYQKFRKGKSWEELYGEVRAKLAKEKFIKLRTGIKLSEAHKQNIKINSIFKEGTENPNWRGGKTYRRYHDMNHSEWYKLRNQILLRDNYTCQKCGKDKCELDIHHKIPYRYTNDNSPSNLITLCKSCHSTVEWMINEYRIRNDHTLDIANEKHKDMVWSAMENELAELGRNDLISLN